jgi:hypothetical protein
MTHPSFYFDRNVGCRFPEALRVLKLDKVSDVYYHHIKRKYIGRDFSHPETGLFKDSESDDSWLQFVGNRGWIVFTQDRKFHKAGFENEISAIKQFNVGCFYLWGSRDTSEKKATVFLKALDRIRYAIANTQKPYIYDVSKSGQLTPIKIP